MKKIKKVVVTIIASLVALPVKVLGANELIPYFETNTYSGRPIAETIMEDGWNIVKILIIPFISIAVFLLYIKRHPESKLKKIFKIKNKIICIILLFLLIILFMVFYK